jgi:hypothetical protein
LWPPAGSAGSRDGAWDIDALELPAGAWFATLLFVLFLLASIGLAVYALGRPFLPATLW